MPRKRENSTHRLTDAEKKRLKIMDEKIAKFNNLDIENRIIKHHFFKLDILANVKSSLLP